MKKNILIAVAIIVIGLGAWYAYGQFGSEPLKNVSLMGSGSELAVSVTEDVAYFEGARGYFVRPEAAGTYPGIVMIHENRGLRPEIKDAATELAKEGYMVLAVDLLGGVAEDQEGARELTGAFDQAEGVANMQAATSYLRAEGATKIASLGWCFGGKQSLELARSGEAVDATVIYYGGGIATSTEALASVSAPVLGIFGDQDRVIPLETVTAFEASLDTLGIQNEIHVYEGVGHAFANPSGESYAPVPTEDAWKKTLAFLERTLR
ncbi:MAG: dienelactone hydrolase family protein [Patescibacteria group bacterium]